VTGLRLRSGGSLAVTAVVPLCLIGLTWLVGMSGGGALRAEVSLILSTLVVVLGLQLFVGNSGIYSFGHVAFVSVGAYATALITLPALYRGLEVPDLPGFLAAVQVSPWTAVGAAGALCAAFALLVGIPLMRTSTLAIPISTFAFLLVVYNVIANWEALTAGDAGLTGIPTRDTLGPAALLAGVSVLVALLFKFSATGYRLRASGEDEVAARATGVRIGRERLLAFVLSAAMCGVGGALAVQQSGVLTPSTFYFATTVTTLTMLVVGGTGSVLGAVCGALAIGLVGELLREAEEGVSLFGLVRVGETPGLAAIGLGLILLLAIILMPEGLTRGREAGELRDAGGGARGGDGEPSASRPIARTGGRLQARGVSVSFAGLGVLHSVDLDLGQGELLGLIGPNGAGKTTLVNVLSGFQRPGAGDVLLDGRRITTLSPAARARSGLARTFQSSLPFAHLTALESVAVGALACGRPKRDAGRAASRILALLGLGREADMEAGSLPPGRQRLLGVARALAAAPRYLLLDEPAAGMNDAESEELVTILSQVGDAFGCGMLLIEHDMKVVMDLCPRIQVLDAGTTVMIGTPEAVRADPRVIESYLGSAYAAVGDA
jgi:branched-chain amino acid transport system permease protein